MAQSRTKPSTPRLSEFARQFKFPSGIVTTGWPAVEAKAAEVGIHYDWWQQQAGKVALGKRADGKYAATVGGVCLSIARQVGKTFWVGSMIVMLCLIFPGLQVVWTAHRTRTSTRTFQALQRMVKRKKIWPHVDAIRKTNGEQEIHFRNGSVIMFGAREQGFGRGFDEIDVEVFDEAQILTDKALEDMVAATNQSRHPHGALIFFIGTPPRPVDPGEAFGAKREQALAGNDDIFYVEFAADPDAKLDDHAQWAKANPSYPKRTPLESMLRLRANLPSDDSWRREALGIWDAEGSRTVYPLDLWDALEDETSHIPPGAHLVFAVDVSWDRAIAHIAVAGVREDGLRHVQVVAAESPSGVAGWLSARVREFAPLAIAVQGSSAPASSLVEELDKVGAAVHRLNGGEMAKAHGSMFDAIQVGRVRHLGEPNIRQQAATAVARTLPDGGLVLDRKKSPLDISGLVAITEALWVLDELVGSAGYDIASSVA